MIAKIKKSLEERKVYGDLLLDSLDIAEDIMRVGGLVTSEGFAVLYHATSKESYDSIKKEGYMFGKENGIFFSTKIDGEISGYGECVLKALIPLERLLLDDEFSDELHFKVEVPAYKKVAIRLYE